VSLLQPFFVDVPAQRLLRRMVVQHLLPSLPAPTDRLLTKKCDQAEFFATFTNVKTNPPRIVLAVVLLAAIGACSSSSSRTGFGDDPTGDGSEAGTGSSGGFGEAGSMEGGATEGGTVTMVTTVYANTDDALYALDPATNAVTMIGKFSGVGGGTGDTSVTDCAVNAAGEVYVNTETVLYKATLPAGGTGAVNLTKVASISVKSGQKFYALAFAPPGVLGSGEGLIGGDGSGVLWSIDPSSGATTQLGSFGKDGTSRVFALSGDVVFYVDGAGKATGLATIRSCASGGTNCTTTNDYLAGIDMKALSAAFTSGTPAGSLLAGIYGGSTSGKGPGIGHGDVFGLGAWEGNVFGFTRSSGGNGPTLLSIDPKSGAGKELPGSFSFSNGWSGAGVTTKVTVTVPPPPPPPA
jgi:hypothetical protein